MFRIIFCFFLVVVALTRDTLAFPQQSDESSEDDRYPVDGFIFDGPADRSPVESTTERRRPSSTSTTERRRPSSTSTTETTITTSSSPQSAFDNCVSSCPVTPEYNPVCGTDTVSYDNPGRLSCAALCGKTVTLNYYGRCAVGQARG